MTATRTVQFLWYEQPNNSDTAFDIHKCLGVATFPDVPLSMDPILQCCNNALPQWLQSRGLKQFIPLQKYTITQEAGGVIQVCYYMCLSVHATVFDSEPGFLLMPRGELATKLHQLYLMHGLNGWEDKRAQTPTSSE